jgi:DNA repair protein RecO (recombination protein O)
VASLKVRGLVISAKQHKEQDRLIRILTSDQGVLLACAPGAGKLGSRHALSAQPGTLSDFNLNFSRGFYYLSESELTEPFRGLYEDIERLTCAAHILEIASDLCVSQEISSAVYPYAVCALHALSGSKRKPTLVVSAFEWKMMDLAGYSADLSGCSCGRAAADERYAFSMSGCRLYCLRPGCLSSSGDYRVVSRGTVEALRYIQSSENTRLFSFTVNEEILDEMTDLTRLYLCEHLEKKYCKMDLLASSEDFLKI